MSLHQARQERALRKAPSSKERKLILLLSSLNRLWSATSPGTIPGANSYLILSRRSTHFHKLFLVRLNPRPHLSGSKYRNCTQFAMESLTHLMPLTSELESRSLPKRITFSQDVTHCRNLGV